MRVIIRDGERLVDIFTQAPTAKGNLPSHTRRYIENAAVNGYSVEIGPEPKCHAVRVEVLKCKHCPKLAVSIGDGSGGTRITNHKCVGAWETIMSDKVNPEHIIKAVSDACRSIDESIIETRKASGTHAAAGEKELK